jgi:hypothetical protein
MFKITAHRMRALKAAGRRVWSDISKVSSAIALTAALPAFFRKQITVEQAKEQTRQLLETRIPCFLDLVRDEIYDNPSSPYRRLLAHAGCEFGTLREEMLRHGIEPTLAKLASEGVYVTSDEFKGKTEIVRGSTVFRVSPADFERRHRSVGMVIFSSGTSNAPVRTFVPLEWLGVQAIANAIFYAANNLLSLSQAIYEPVITGRIVNQLVLARLGLATERWFAVRVSAHGRVEEAYHRLNAHLVASLGRWYGPGIANPEYVVRDDLEPVARWITQNRQRGKECAIKSVVSHATALSRRATESGFSFEGIAFVVSGEPLTEVKRQIIERTGARIALRYGIGGGMAAALGCPRAGTTDDLHVPQFLWTCISHPWPLNDIQRRVHPVLLTTMHPLAPRMLFNVQNGDCATLTTKECGCALQEAGFTQHVQTVRSFEKLTGEGMNYFGVDLAALIEGILPSEFGGGLGDYQVVEEDDDTGRTRITLIVHPSVGPIDNARLLARLHEGLSADSRNSRFMATMWRDAGSFRVRREPPYSSARGKIPPLRVSR